ncbi:hypothetical protein [Haloarchaeobius sp. DT45]|uniref:hypothetical protein n=1 Tax=Haloarchaeobius sp. DT45 TaxID=3446116 RepID=UPI003F6AFA7E
MRGRLATLLTVAVLVMLAGCSATSYGVSTDSLSTVGPDADDPVPITQTAATGTDDAAGAVGPTATPDPTRTIHHEGDLVVTTRTRYESVHLVVTGDIVVTDEGSLVLEDSVVELPGDADRKAANTSKADSDPAIAVRGQGRLAAETVAFATVPETTLAYADRATVDLRNVSHRSGSTVHRATDGAHLTVTDSQLDVVGFDEATVDVQSCTCHVTVPLPGDADPFSFPSGFTRDYRFVVSSDDTAVTVHVTDSVLRAERSDGDE